MNVTNSISQPNRNQFKGAPKGAFELAYVIFLYEKFRKKPSNLNQRISDLCQELNGINIYVIEVALSIYKKQVARQNKAYHPRYFINLVKKLSKQIKSIPIKYKTEEIDEYLKIPLGKAI
jgi:hypothetical protein